LPNRFFDFLDRAHDRHFNPAAGLPQLSAGPADREVYDG
jgi:hypothetical protein